MVLIASGPPLDAVLGFTRCDQSFGKVVSKSCEYSGTEIETGPGKSLSDHQVGNLKHSHDVGENRRNVDLVLAGDTAAFARLVQRWQGPLINMAWRFCRDRERAEDMAQEAFLRAYRNLGQWRRDAAFSTWLFALATNLYRSELKRIPATMLSLDELAEPPDSRLHQISLEDAQQAEMLYRAVLALSGKYRDAVTLYYFHEESVPTAALSLGVPEGTLTPRSRAAPGENVQGSCDCSIFRIFYRSHEGPEMTDQEIDIALLGKDDSLPPSSGFLSSVMTAVQSEASALPATPFPWKRTVPGIVGSIAVLIALLASFVSAWRPPQLSSVASAQLLARCTLLSDLLQRPATLSTTVTVFLVILCTQGPWRFGRLR